MVRIAGTCYCDIFYQPFAQYLDLSSCFNKTMPRLTVLAERLHSYALLSAETPDSIGPQYWPPRSRIAIRLRDLRGAFCKSECTVAIFVTSTIWMNNWFTNGAALISVLLIRAGSQWWQHLRRKADTLNIIVRLRTSCYWVVVQSYVSVILFTVWFLTKLRRIFHKLYIIVFNTYGYAFIKLVLIR